MKIFDKNNVELYDIAVDDSSVRYRSIMTDDSLVLNFSLTESISIPQFSYVEFEGQRYTLWRPQEFKKHSSRNHEYTLTLHGYREFLKFVKYKDMSAKPYRLKFSLTAKPVAFLQNLIACLNAADPAGGWAAGDCIDAPEKTLSFNHEYCIDALGRMTQEWETEFEFEGKTIHLRKVEKFKTAPLALSYGKGNGFLPGVGRYNEGDKQPVGRLYVQGGERNIDFSTYSSKSLLLPKSQTLVYDGKTYRADPDGMYITRDGNTNTAEDSYDASDIYPKRVGTVSEVIVIDAEKHFYDIKDSHIPEALNYRDCRIAGEKAIIKFESGALAGREFDIEQTDTELIGYIHAERRFKIVPQKLDGVVMPGGAFVPAVGDKYAIFNISMPAAYISDDATQTGASWDMFREAVRYFAENEADRFRFTGELDGIWSKSRWLEIGGKIVPGGHVLFSDEQFQPDGVVVRIVAVKDYVNKPHKPEITLSNAPVSGSFSSTLGKLEANEVVVEESKKEVIRFTKRSYRDALETISMLQASMLNFADGISPITVQTMLLLVGDNALQFTFRNDHTVTWNKATKQLYVSNGDLKPLIYIRNICPQHANTQYGQFILQAYTSPTLTDARKAYYLYARCGTSGSDPSVFLLSENAYKIDHEASRYYFLVGILNSEQEDGERSFVRLHGITEVLPGRINTDKIVSTDGKTYFDLINGIIAGRIKFINSQGVEQQLTEPLDGKSPYIGTNGNWWEWDDDAGEYVDTHVIAEGQDGYTPVKGVDYFDGAPGQDGYTPVKGVDYFDGTPGQNGDDGISSYMHIRYSQNASGNPMTTDPEGAVYIGIAVTQSNTPPSSYSSYTWSLIKGTDGIPGEHGADGQTSYLHIKYSDDGGQTFTANNGEIVGTWIGMYVDFTQADSNNPADYTWNKVKGDKGDTGDQGPKGDGVLIRYKRSETRPEKPADTELNPIGWLTAPDKPDNVDIFDLVFTGDWTQQENGEWKSKTITHNEKTAIRVKFRTYQDNVIVKITARVSSENNYDKLHISKLNTEFGTNYVDELKNISGTKTDVLTYNVLAKGEHWVDFEYAKDGSTSSGDDAAYISISLPVKTVWMTTCAVANGVGLGWSVPRIYLDERTEEIIAKTYKSAAVTDKFGTTVDGGLISTVITELRSLSSLLVTAGISGIQGENNDLPALWAGGTYAEALAAQALAILYHSGRLRLGGAGVHTVYDGMGMRVFNELGKMNILFGMKNGYAVLEYYDNNGDLLYDLGPGGIGEIDVRAATFTPVNNLIFLGNVTFAAALTTESIKIKYKNSAVQTTTTYYRYSSGIVGGVVQNPSDDGRIFTQDRINSSKIADGIYCYKMQTDMTYETGGTNNPITPPGIDLNNETVYDRDPLWVKYLLKFVSGEIVEQQKAYWNDEE